VPVVERWQRMLHPVSAYVVLPVFALANAGVDLRGGVLGHALTSPVGLGVGRGLVLGKPLGIVLASLLAVRTRAARLPEGARWSHMVGVGAVAGIGFTVSLFIAGLSFPDTPGLTADAKVGILLGSVVAAGLGVLLLARTRPSEVSAPER
jgi:NhaA family Na+:H+ antiporter